MSDSIENVTDRHWDAIVIGTGMGGATLGHALAKAGQSVLFCEKGRASFPEDMAVRGDYAEMFAARGRDGPWSAANEGGRAGRDFDEIDDRSAVAMRSFVPFIGAGAGGSSALYGMALERFSPADFVPGAHHADAHGSTVPEKWPVSFADMEPYYAAAEELYRVILPARATTRGLPGEAQRTVPPLSAAARELTDFLVGKDLHPYRLPLACEFVEGCRGCQGFLCAMSCKNDATRICLQPAVERYGARVLDDCRVTRVVADARSVSGVVCSRGGREHLVRGRKVILAAGALASPALLLASASEHWPDGLANRSGYVGRNLMRHCIDLYAVFLKQRPSIAGNGKEIAFNDFYANERMKLGSVQSFGPMPPAPMLVDNLRQELAATHGKWASLMFEAASPLVRPVLHALFSRSLVLASLMEDLPYADNRVTIEPMAGGGHRTTLRYRLHAHEQARVAQFRSEMKKALSPYRFLRLKEAENNQRLAHACGTCRFGSDARDSVLDAHNRAHDVDNLYVVDASFFPSSGGTNPSLTIAANALRVADHLR